MYFITAPIDCSSSARQVNRMIPIIIIYCYCGIEARSEIQEGTKKSVKMSSTAKSSTISRWTSVISLLLLVDVNLVTLKF
jgi:hypothetical protein